MTDRNDFGLLMMTRGVSPAARVSTKVEDGVPFEAWTTWRCLGFGRAGRLVVADFDFDDDGFDTELERDDFRAGDVQVLVSFDGERVVAKMSPEAFDEHATRISAREMGCGDEECECGDQVVPVDIELLDELVTPQLATFTDDSSDTDQEPSA